MPAVTSELRRARLRLRYRGWGRLLSRMSDGRLPSRSSWRRISSADRVALLLAIPALMDVLLWTVLGSNRELFPRGAEVGSAAYDLSVAYLASCIFYVLVVVRPTLANRTRIRPTLSEAVDRMVGDLQAIFDEMSGRPGSMVAGRTTAADVERMCKAADPRKPVKRAYLQADRTAAIREVTVWNVVEERLARTARSLDRLVRLMPFLDAEIARLVDELDTRGLTWQVRDFLPILIASKNATFESWASQFAEYNDIVGRIRAYADRELRA
jgi:hypothetical protein